MNAKRPHQAGWTGREARVVLAVGLAFGLGVLYEIEPLNGIRSLTRWEWPWQDLGAFEMGFALLLPFLLIGAVLWRAEKREPSSRPWLMLGLLAISSFLLQLFSVLGDPRGLPRIEQLVASPDVTSYFTAALDIKNPAEWLKRFHESTLPGHASTHPAGPVLFYYAFLTLFGPSTGALLGGCAVGLAASAGVLVMYSFAGLWTAERRARLLACAFYALLPGLTVFFPEFDQVYPVFSMLIILCWVRALASPDRWWKEALLLGAVLFAATFFAYNLLVIGAFLVYYVLHRRAWAAALRAGAVALGAGAALYLALWITAGYNAPAAFLRALESQAAHARVLNRSYAAFVLMDLYDFALSAGVIVVPILVYHLRGLRAKDAGAALTLIGVGTILTVDLTGLLRGEAARVWLFLQPLLMAPAGVELARFRWPWRIAILAVQWWILVCVKAKMAFLEP
jgi:hypothetical protein